MNDKNKVTNDYQKANNDLFNTELILEINGKKIDCTDKAIIDTFKVK